MRGFAQIPGFLFRPESIAVKLLTGGGDSGRELAAGGGLSQLFVGQPPEYPQPQLKNSPMMFAPCSQEIRVALRAVL